MNIVSRCLTREQYRQARSLIRSNGAYALRWMDPVIADQMRILQWIQKQRDWLADRATHFLKDSTKARMILTRC